jgi:uncharacterized protein
LLERAAELNGRDDRELNGASADKFGRAVSNALGAWTEQVQRFALVVVLAAVVLTGFAAVYTARNLAMNTSTTDMIDAATPFRRNDAAFKNAFPQYSDVLVVVIDGPNPEAAQIAAAGLTTALAARPDLFESVSQPDDDPFFKRHGLLFLDAAALAALADRLAAAEPLLAVLADQPNLAGLFEIIRLAATNDGAGLDNMSVLLDRVADVMDAQRGGARANLSWRGLLTEKMSTRRIILTRPRLDYGGLKPAAAAINEIRTLAAARGVTPANGLTVRLTGSVALDQAELESVELGGKTAGILSLALVCVLLVLGLRSARLIVASLATLVIGLIWTAAFAAVAIGHLNLISVAFAVLFVGLAVDFSLHYCLRFREALAGGLDGRAAITETARGCGAALTLSAVCAAVGFLSFLPTDYKGLAELGLISGCAMFIALFANLTVLPALLALFGKGVGGFAPRSGRGAGRFDVSRIRIPVLAVALGVGAVAAVASWQLRFDFNPLNLKDPESESMAAFLDLADDPRTAPYSIDVLARDLDAATAEAARLSKLPLVGDVVTLASFVPGNQAEKLSIIEDMAFFLAPALGRPDDNAPPLDESARRGAFDALRSALSGRDEPAFVRLRQSMDRLGESNPDLAELETRLTGYLPVTLEDLRLFLSVNAVGLKDIPDRLRRDWVSPSGAARVQVRPARPLVDNDAIRAFAQAVLAAQPRASGAPVTISEAGRVVVGAFWEATVIALALIAVVLFVVLRRAGRVLLILGPLALAAVLTIATSVVFGLPFNFANVIVLPLLLGLGVASGVHLVMRGQTAASLRGSSTPRAVLYSALTTLASFGSLMASGHRGMVSMGQLLTISIAYMLIAMLVVLPAQMAWLEKRGD